MQTADEPSLYNTVWHRLAFCQESSGHLHAFLPLQQHQPNPSGYHEGPRGAEKFAVQIMKLFTVTKDVQ